MNVKLISNDPELANLCREVLADVSEQTCLLSGGLPDAGPDGDVCIWDFPFQAKSVPDIGSNPSRHLFVVQRNDLPRFREQITAAAAKILLKPVTRVTLEVFLTQAVADYQENEAATTLLRADRDEILQCLIQTNLRLQEYDQDRTTFLARAVHDFRAPLTALTGYSGLLLEEPLGPLSDGQKEILRRMHHSAKRLSRMAAAMFQLSVGRHVKRRPDLKPGDIRECIEQALHEIMPFADDKRIEIRTDVSVSDVPLQFESGQIEQVLINILDNACKFTPKAGLIEIRGYPFFWERRAARSHRGLSSERRQHTSTVPNTYRVDIQDSGASIPEDHLERIFEEYTSYAGGCDRSGGGLGLAIARMILSQHEGRVWAENTDFGPRFSFVLPIYQREFPIYLTQYRERLNQVEERQC
jgi:signal transduction histidine kinase